MKPNNDSSLSSAESISRRTALERVVVAGLGLAALSVHAAESVAPNPDREPEFVPENDYPDFGYVPTE